MKLRVPHSLHEWQHKAEHFFHMSYLGFTYVEGHGWHANAAGTLFLVVFVGMFVQSDAA